MSNPQSEASSTSSGQQPAASHPEATLEPALQLSPQAKPKPIEELSVKEANDMTCAICLDQIPVQELCAIKSCDHVYCGASNSLCLGINLCLLAVACLLACPTVQALLCLDVLLARGSESYVSSMRHGRRNCKVSQLCAQASAFWPGQCTGTRQHARSARRPSPRCSPTASWMAPCRTMLWRRASVC